MSKIILVEQASPSAPAADKVAIYSKAGGGLYKMDDSGMEVRLDLGRCYGGSSTFAGATGVVVSIGATLAGTTYRVAIMPTADSENVGAIYVASKTATTFKVHCTGTGTPTFDWTVLDQN